MKHFREVLTGIDPAPLLAQLSDRPELWGTETEWTRKKPESVIYREENIVLRYLTGGDREHWDRPAFRLLSEARPIVQRLLGAVGDILGLVVITRLPPGGSIAEHTDQWLHNEPRLWHRHQVPLAVSPRCRFRCGDEELWMRPGSAYWFDNGQLHSVENESNEERVSMIVDLHLF
jgi:quercetin dioxygenase-like cupin family protein